MDWAQIHNATGTAAWWTRLAVQQAKGEWSTSRPFQDRISWIERVEKPFVRRLLKAKRLKISGIRMMSHLEARDAYDY